MTIRRHADPPDLREGCYPAKDCRHPPHDHRTGTDALTIEVVRADQYDTLPVIYPGGRIEYVSGRDIIKCMTGNGWSVYVPNIDGVQWLLRLAAAGRDGVLEWMRGATYAEAEASAASVWRLEREAREARRRQPANAVPLADLISDEDI